MERTVAKCLLEIKSVYFGFDDEFRSKDGFCMPVYTDNRLILSYPIVRNALTKWLSRHVKENYPDVEMIVGTAVNGISFATLLSVSLNLPMAYVLEKTKEHGLKNRFEGIIKPHTKVIIVDDVVCTGKTLLEVNDVLKDLGFDCLGAVSIFSYDLESTNQMLKEAGIHNTSLTNFDVVSLIGMQNGLINYEQYLQTKKFKENPYSLDWKKNSK